MVAVVAAVLVVGLPVGVWARKSHGFPAFARSERPAPEPVRSGTGHPD
jgi:hypothetical protein